MQAFITVINGFIFVIKGVTAADSLYTVYRLSNKEGDLTQEETVKRISEASFAIFQTADLFLGVCRPTSGAYADVFKGAQVFTAIGSGFLHVVKKAVVIDNKSPSFKSSLEIFKIFLFRI